MNLPQIPLRALLAAALADHPGWLDSIGYQINGLIVVFVALGLIWGMLELMGLLFRRTGRKSISMPAAIPVVAPAAVVPEGVTLEQVAAISAAIELVLDAPHRIEAIMPAEPVLDWAHEGRRQIFASHKTR